MKLRTTVFALAFLLSLSWLAAAQEKPKQPQSGTPKLVMASFKHDLGEIKPGDPLTYTFKVKNEGTAELQIINVAPS